MRHVEGYVFIADFGKFQELFGRKVKRSRSDGDYCNIKSNGLEPYETEQDAKNGGREFAAKRQKSGLRKVVLAELKVDMAETQEEANNEFGNETDLIAVPISVWGDEREYHFMGPVVKGKPTAHPIPGAYLIDTNFRTFRRKKNLTKNDYFKTPFAKARYLAKEALRQGAGEGVTIAKFKLKRLGEIT